MAGVERVDVWWGPADFFSPEKHEVLPSRTALDMVLGSSPKWAQMTRNGDVGAVKNLSASYRTILSRSWLSWAAWPITAHRMAVSPLFIARRTLARK